MLVLHLLNRLIAAVVALVVVAAAVVTTVEVIRWGLDMSSWLVPWRDWGQTLSTITADDEGLLLVSGVAAVVGLLLLAFELKRRRPDGLTTQPLLDGVPTIATRRGVASAATTAARSISGVTDATAGVRRGKVSVDVTTRARGERKALEPDVRAAVQQSLDDLAVEPRPKVKIDVKEAG